MKRSVLLSLSVVTALLALVLSACANESSSRESSWSMPSKADEIHLSWIAGPPQMQVFRPYDTYLKGFRDEAATLSFRSQKWGMLFDPRKLTIHRLTREPSNTAAAETLDYSSVLREWSKSRLDMHVKIRGRKYFPTGGMLDPEDPRYSPIHIVESGPWFQHVAIYDLELIDIAGKEKLDAKSWLEIRAWGDRCLFEWYVVPADSARARMTLGLESSDGKVKQSAVSAGTARVQLALNFESGEPLLLKPESDVKISVASRNEYATAQPEVIYSHDTDAWEILIHRQEWPKASTGAAFNADLLDRISRFDLVFENQSNEAKDINFRFIHNYHPIAGYVPMMLNADGEQTGLPLQNSKNWHSLPKQAFPYEGTWINVTSRLTLEPNSKVDLQYAVAHAQWQGVPASSAAQLGLTGWGYNGFWTQMALGSWGETLCIQPGRTMRRAFVTDVRPFEMLSNAGLPYDWTTNVGGADIAHMIDSTGQYVMWQGAVRQFEMIGPNLSHINLIERSADRKMRLEIDTYLPRSNSINRSYFKVRMDVLADVAFSELALFQLGTDYYNEMDSQKVAWGSKAGLLGERSPKAGEWGGVMAAEPLEGASPWVSLYDNLPDTKRRGRGVRGIVVRDFKAQIGGKTYTTPYLKARRTMGFLAAEVVLPPEIVHLSAGDTIEYTVELDAFPFTAESYYGSNEELKSRLGATPDSWELTAFEAANQGLEIDGQDYVFPATIKAKDFIGEIFKLKSQSSMDSLIVEGLGHPSTWELFEVLDGKVQPLGSRFASEAQPQITYDLETSTWAVVLSLVFPEGASERSLQIRQK